MIPLPFAEGSDEALCCGHGSGAEHTVFPECLERRDREEQPGSGDRYIFVD